MAMDVGFSNVSYFNRLFKKKFRMTPLEYGNGEKKGKMGLVRMVISWYNKEG